MKVTTTNTGENGVTLVGLINGSFTGDQADIDYSWGIYSGIAFYRINGNSFAYISTTSGDTFEVKINGTTVEWYRNNSLIWSVPGQTLTYPYRAAVSFSDTTSPKITSAQMTGVSSQEFWTNVFGATASGSSLIATAAGGHGESTQSITSGNGSVKATMTDTGQNGFTQVGLINGSYTGNETEIDYSWRVYSGIAFYRINGNSFAYISTTSGDTFEVKINGTTVEWYRNNSLIWSVPGQTLTYPYRAAVSFSDTTSPKITSAQMTGTQ